MLPFGWMLVFVSYRYDMRLAAHAVPMMTDAPPAVGAGSPPLPKPFSVEAAAGVGPEFKGETPSEAGAETRRTLMARWRRRTSVKNLA